MEQSSLMDTEVCTQSSCQEDSVGVTGIPIKKDLGTVSLKSVVVLKDSDVTIRNGVVFMPNTIEMAQIKKQEKGQFKTQMCISSNMTQGDIKQVLVEAFPFLEGQRFYCAAAVDNRTRLDFHGSPRIWDGLYIKRKIKGNSALYILTDESTVTLKRSYDEIITPEESEKPEQPLKKETEPAIDQRHSACSNRCPLESDLMEQSSSSLFAMPKVSNHSSSVGQGAATLHPSNGSTILKKCDNLRPTEGPFLLQKLPDNFSPMVGCFFVPISAQQKACVMSTAAASSNEPAHQQKFMVAEGTVLQGAGVQKASVKQSSGRELSDNITGTECSEVPVASQRVVPSGLTPPMLNLNISDVSSLQSCKVHLEKMTQKQYQGSQTGKDGKEARRFLQETPATGAEASRKCSTVTILKEASFSDVFRCQVAEKSVSNDKSKHSDSGMETSDQNKASNFHLLIDAACNALKAGVTGQSSENEIQQPAMEDKSIIEDICPMHGPLSGGNPFYISLKEFMPEDVRSGLAIFRAVGTVELIKLDNFRFFGLQIPPASLPGRVDVKVQTSDGQYLGSTVFTYVDEDQEAFRRFITSDRLQAKFFNFLAQELTIRESKTEQDGASTCSNPEKRGMGANIPQLSRQSDLTQMLDRLAIVDDLGKSSVGSYPVEESGELEKAGNTSRHEEKEICINMGDKDEACKDENSASDQSRRAQYSREGEKSMLPIAKDCK